MAKKRISSVQRKKNKEDEEILQAFAKENRLEVALTPQKLVVFSVFALGAVLVPTYFFQNALKMDLLSSTFNMILIAVVCVPAVVLLVQGYHALYKRQKYRLSQIYSKQLSSSSALQKNKTISSDDVDSQKEKMAELGATGYALWFTNAVFILVAIVVTRHILASQSPRFSYPTGVLLGAFAARFLSSQTTSNKRRK